MAINHTKHGWNQYTDFASATSGVNYSIPGIEVGDTILRVCTAHWATSSGSLTVTARTASEFSISANKITYGGSSKSFPDMLILVTWVDADGDKAGV